jgi:hypothetical protein
MSSHNVPLNLKEFTFFEHTVQSLNPNFLDILLTTHVMALKHRCLIKISDRIKIVYLTFWVQHKVLILQFQNWCGWTGKAAPARSAAGGQRAGGSAGRVAIRQET